MMAETNDNMDLPATNKLQENTTEDSTTNSRPPPCPQEVCDTEKGDGSRTGPQFLATGIVSLTGFLMGEMVSWSSPVTPLLIKSHRITKDEESWIVSTVNFGAIIGCLLAGYVNKYVGRKTVLLSLCVPEMISWLMLAFCEGAILLCLARFLSGLCLGFICVTTPLYIAEIAQPCVRGALATFFQLFIVIGILFTFILGILQDALWITLGCSIVVLVFFALFLWMPESPVYLTMVSRPKAAAASLQWLRGRDYDIYAEIRVIEAVVQEGRDVEVTYGDFISDAASFRGIIIAMGLFFFQQMCGINVVIFYMNTVFETAGSTISPTLATVIIGIVQVLATALSVYMMDKAGRRFLFIFSQAACSLCLISLGTYFFLKSRGNDVTPIGWLPVASVAVFLIMFAFGSGPVPWAITSEIFSKNIASLALSLVTAVHWLLAFFVTKVYTSLEAFMGTGPTFWMFAAWCWVGVTFCCLLMPETKGRPQEDIVDELRGCKKKQTSSSCP
ncbi:facilitated trehalose transporter Tret1 isoform X1 [Bemisia tabaci]|uniref:facilitated trehalose transporter Tret1 isoform X1 n=2 Tax=Bemisia tabaci TaxID=7038 RepID=UPI003B280D88